MGRFEQVLSRHQQQADILAAQADALIHDEDRTDDLLRQAEGDPRLADLLVLARQVKSVLVPVEPSPEYVADLKRELMGTRAESIRAAQRGLTARVRSGARKLHPAWAVAAIVTSLAGSVLAVVAITNRRRRLTTGHPISAI
jgi:hypothetical protein